MVSSAKKLAALLLGSSAVTANGHAFVPPLAAGPSVPQPAWQAAQGAGEVEFGAPRLAAPPAAGADAEQGPSFLKWIGAGLAAGLILAVSSSPAEAFGPKAPDTTGKPVLTQFTIKNAKHLLLCKDSKKYHKKIKDQIYKITQRQKKYPKGSVVFNRFEAKIAQVKRREQAYGDRYCGKRDGLPRTVATGEIVRGNVVIPGLMFLYTAGWIGWAGRSYLIRTQDEMKELNIDVPLALTCMASGFAWPVAAWQSIVNGEMAVKDTDLHRSFF